MEDKLLHEAPTESRVSASYKILTFKSSELPENYTAFLYAKWLRSLRYGNMLFKRIKPDEYYLNYKIFIEKLLNKPDSLVRLAVLTDDDDVILGFAVSREDVLDYIYVHTDYRKNHIGTKLFPEGITTFTHLTLITIDIWNTVPRYKQLNFNPFA